MKRLYARLVLWLIRPALESAAREAAVSVRIETLTAACAANAAAIAREVRSRAALEAVTRSALR
ncbi:hypothetical protein B0G83_105364 [Paraburkholderia sp. BL21I4N1]|nr:hypothetical protein B0G83_105364 [Paraburkholderia sp. BL21I4N1]